jgi:3-oxoacyl-[acyl-carrier-protein] synthase II
MTTLVITGVGSVRPTRTPVPTNGVDSLPGRQAYLVTDFDPVQVLGRRAARSNHRTALLAMAACRAALADARFEVNEEVRDGVGVSFGTTCGSMSGAVEFGWDSFAEQHPYQVNPATFPNLMLNAAAAAAAIRYGLRGANTTVAGGPLAGLAALRHAQVTLRACHADTVLAGAAEEFTGPQAWLAAALRPAAVPGEGAAAFVLEPAEVALAAGRRPLARLAAVLLRTLDVSDPAAYRDAVRDALARAEVSSGGVRSVAVRRTGSTTGDAALLAGLAEAVHLRPTDSEEEIGDCFSAHAALQLAELVSQARAQGWAPDEAGVVLAADPDGALAVAVLAGAPRA